MKRAFAVSAAVASGWRALAGPPSPRLMPQTRLSGPMPWVIAIMILLSSLAGAGALALTNASGNAGAAVADAVTIQVTEPAAAARDAQARAIVAALERSRIVREVRRVPREEIEALVAPWLGAELMGSSAAEAAVPIPDLIDARLTGGSGEAQVAALRRLVAPLAPGARVDTQGRWLAPVFLALDTLRWLAAGLIALLGLTTVAAVLLAAKSALAAHQETVEVIHHLGGSDRQIAHIFERSAAIDAAIGGVAGLSLAVVVMALVRQPLSGLGGELRQGDLLEPLDWVILALIPLAGVALATVTARLTVLGRLRTWL